MKMHTYALVVEYLQSVDHAKSRIKVFEIPDDMTLIEAMKRMWEAMGSLSIFSVRVELILHL